MSTHYSDTPHNHAGHHTGTATALSAQMPQVAGNTFSNGHLLQSAQITFRDYLRAKRSVDDRALHPAVYSEFAARLATMDRPVEILEIGCGIGTMVERLDRWGFWQRLQYPATYTALDQDPANLEDLPMLAPERVQVTPTCGEFHVFAAESIAAGRKWDALIANAVLDLFNLDRALPLLHDLLHVDGVAWLTLNFDAGTILQPTIDSAFDDLVEARYHQTMDERMTDGAPSGDSRTGRHLFTALPRAGLQILATGASDWVVTPHAGRYPAEEATFLHFIIETMHSALLHDPMLDPARFAEWIHIRKQQIDAGALTYLAKQYDFTVRKTLSSIPAEEAK